MNSSPNTCSEKATSASPARALSSRSRGVRASGLAKRDRNAGYSQPRPSGYNARHALSVANQGNFFTTWAALSLLTLVMTLVMSGAMLYRYYHRPTLAQWQHKSNPHYPDVTMVRRELLLMLKGLLVATACPAAALHLVNSGVSQAYCGVGDRGWGYLAIGALEELNRIPAE